MAPEEATRLRGELRDVRKVFREARAVLEAGEHVKAAGLAHVNAVERIRVGMAKLTKIEDDLTRYEGAGSSPGTPRS